MPLIVYLQILFCTFLWGTAFPVGKTALQHCGPLHVAGIRFALAGLILLLASLFINEKPLSIHALHGRTGPMKARWGYVMLIGLVGTCMFYGLFFMGVNMTSASSAAAVDAASPIIGAIMAHFFLHQDRLSARKIVALVTAFAGIAIIAVLRPHGAGANVSTLGCVTILLSLFFGACSTILVIRYTGTLSLIRLTGFQMCFGGALLLVLAHWREGAIDWSAPGAWHLAVQLFWLALVSATAFRIWYGILRKYKVTSLAIFAFLPGTWGVILSVIFLKDPVGWPLLVGGGLVICGVLQMHLNNEGAARVQVVQPAT